MQEKYTRGKITTALIKYENLLGGINLNYSRVEVAAILQSPAQKSSRVRK